MDRAWVTKTFADWQARFARTGGATPLQISEVLYRAVRHIVLHLDGDQTTDHLHQAVWDLLVAMDGECRRGRFLDLWRPDGPSVVDANLPTLPRRAPEGRPGDDRAV